MAQRGNNVQKHLNFLQYSLGSLTVYRARTIAVVFSLTAAVFLLGSIAFISDGLTREAVTAAGSAPDITVQGMLAGRVAPISLTYAGKIARIDGVDRVVPRMWGYILYDNNIYTIMGLDPDVMDTQLVPELNLVQGRFPKTDEYGAAVIGANLAYSENLGLNDTFELKSMSGGMLPEGISLQVVGIFSSSINLYTSDLILVNTYDAQRALLVSRASAATDLCVYLSDPSQSSSVASQIIRSFPELRVLTRQAIVGATETTYGLRGGFATIMWFMLLATVVLIAWNQTSTVGQDSKREVGILKTLGFGTLDILEIRLIESVALGFISASIGVFLAVVYDVYFGAPFLRDLMLGWSASFPSFTLPLEISASRLMMLYAVAVFPLLLGSLVPSWLSAITEPDTVLRGG